MNSDINGPTVTSLPNIGFECPSHNLCVLIFHLTKDSTREVYHTSISIQTRLLKCFVSLF